MRNFTEELSENWTETAAVQARTFPERLSATVRALAGSLRGHEVTAPFG